MSFDTIWFLSINLFYYNFKQSPDTKSFLCLIAFILASYSTFFNYHLLELYPNQPLFMTGIVNSFMRQYLFIDLIYELLKQKIRIDIIIHHLFTLSLFVYLHNYYASTFVTLAEIFSIWQVFNLSHSIKKTLRIVSLFPVRFFIWYKIFCLSTSNTLEYSDNVLCLFISLFMLLLDTYWFYKILYS